MSIRNQEHVILPLEIYKAIRPYIEKLVCETGRPMTYDELADHMFEVLGRHRCPTHAQLGAHISRSKKLVRFRKGSTAYVVSAKSFDSFMRGKI